MAGPPSPPYPVNCGTKWDRSEVVTGELPGKGGFGVDITVELEPLSSYDELLYSGRNRPNSLLDRKLIDLIIDLLKAVENASGAGGRRRLLTSKEEASLLWLLDRAKALLESVNKIRDKWKNRPGGGWPLHLGDDLSTFAGGWCRYPHQYGKWIDTGTPDRPERSRCPSADEIKQRKVDVARIEGLYNDVLKHIRCAQWGLNRILLYKRALAEWKGRDLPELTARPGEAPPIAPELPIAAPTGDLDLCKELGVGCPEGVEPPPGLGGVDLCPWDWCPDPEDLPPPEDVPTEPGLGEPLVPEIKKVTPKERAMSDATKGLITVGAVGLVYAGYKLLMPR